jgi:hypothetical protein
VPLSWPLVVTVAKDLPPTSDAGQGAFWPELAATPLRCEVCGRELDPDARSDARYCSTTCRVRAHRRRTTSHL